jgi:hypothetical protein
MSDNAVIVDKKKVQDYLKVCQKIDELMTQKNAIEGEFEAHVQDTGEVTLCNLLQVKYAKNPPKLVSNTEGGKVTEDVRSALTTLLANTGFVKTSTGLAVKKIHEAKDTDKTVKAALKKVGLTTEQSERMTFDRIVKATKK